MEFNIDEYLEQRKEAAPQETETKEAHAEAAQIDAKAAEIKPPAVEAPGKIEEAKAEATTTATTPEEQKRLSERNAAMYVSLIDLIVSRGCSLFAGGDVERYKLSKVEAEEYKKVSAEYFLTINAQVSPALVFLVSTLTIFSGIFFRAYGDYKTKKAAEAKAEAAEAAAAKAAQLNAEREQQEREAAAKTAATAPVEPKIVHITPPPARLKTYPKKEEIREAVEGRSNFEIYTAKDKKEGSKTWKDSLIGLYKTNPQNERYTYEEAIRAKDNAPTEYVRRMINQFTEQGDTQKEINLKIRKHLKELESFNDE